MSRLRFADDIVLIAQVNGRTLSIANLDQAEAINVATDESFIRSLDRLGFVSLVTGSES